MPRIAPLLLLLFGCTSAPMPADSGPLADAGPGALEHDVRLRCELPSPAVELSGEPFQVSWDVRNNGTSSIRSGTVRVELEAGGAWMERGRADFATILAGESEDGTVFVFAPSVASGDSIDVPVRCIVETSPIDQDRSDNTYPASGDEPLTMRVHGGL